MQKIKALILANSKYAITLGLLGLLVMVVIIISFLSKDSQAFTSPGTSMPATQQTQTSTIEAIATSPSQTPTSTPTIAAPTAVLTPTAIPESHYLEIEAHGKYFYLGCEAAAAVDLAGFYDILIYQYNFQHELPLSDNPDLGFVGDANGPWGQVPPYAYGVHAAPVAALLQQYGLDVVGGKD